MSVVVYLYKYTSQSGFSATSPDVIDLRFSPIRMVSAVLFLLSLHAARMFVL